MTALLTRDVVVDILSCCGGLGTAITCRFLADELRTPADRLDCNLDGRLQTHIVIDRHSQPHTLQPGQRPSTTSSCPTTRSPIFRSIAALTGSSQPPIHQARHAEAAASNRDRRKDFIPLTLQSAALRLEPRLSGLPSGRFSLA